MITIGITGQKGFVGNHLYNTLHLYKDEFECIPFEDYFFQSNSELNAFVAKCDVIVHLAAMNRHPDPNVIYETNVRLIELLIQSMDKEEVKPYVLFSSSTQEDLDNEYGKSKQKGGELLQEWALAKDASFTKMVIPNIYGAFGLPNYNSFIATFCYKLTHGEEPQIVKDGEVNLIYIASLCQYIIDKIRRHFKIGKRHIEKELVSYDFSSKVTSILSLLNYFKTQYFENGYIPELKDRNEINLFNTFRSYINHQEHFPVRLIKHTDPRGMFVETLKLGVGGQVSFSTTFPGITRGNHYHTRKIERFTVIKGKALIQLRKIGSAEILEFTLDGEAPSYVDIPIWYTHNIINIGKEELYTQFWINEWYNPEDGDTYFENV